MDPNQPYPGSPQGNPYEFILNPAKPPRPKRFGFGNNMAVTIAMIVGGALLIMILLTIVTNLLTPEKVGEKELLGLAQSQTELARISEEAVGDSTQQVTKNLATTVQYTMLTQQQQTIKVLGSIGVEVDEEVLALKQNGDTDQRFKNAQSTSTFDATYTAIIEKELNNYAGTLKHLTTQNMSQQERSRVSDYYKQTQQLISQIPYTQDRIESAGSAQ